MGGLIGTALSAAGAVFGGISAARSARKVKKAVEAQRQKNQDWFDRRYNEDATQRGDAQAVLTQTQDALKRNTMAAAGTQAVMGGTDESVAQSKAAANQAVASATSQIAANAANRKDQIESQYMATDNALQDQLNNIEQQRAQSIATAVQGVTSSEGITSLGLDDFKNIKGAL